MTNTDLPLTADSDFDDLPRTLRRERERQAAQSAPSVDPPGPGASYDMDKSGYDTRYEHEPVPASVERLNIPFLRLVGFLIKAVIAAIPALILLTVILWFAGQALQVFFPELIQLKILISFPAEPAAP